VIVTSDGEIDDECSMVRFLLYANEWDVEGIVTSSSQYHWQGHDWAGDDWLEPYLDAYAQVHPHLVKHDAGYPAPDDLRERAHLGNVRAEGEMEEVTAGSQHIVKVLLDEADERPVWLQAWGGPNTIARALKTIEEEHPERMAEVAKKARFFFIWEQDSTYQDYIRPHGVAQPGVSRLGRVGRALCAGAREHVAGSGAGDGVCVPGGALVHGIGVGAKQLAGGNDDNRGAAPGVFRADVALDGCAAERFCGPSGLVREIA
jgi:hypothetical protein